MNSITKNDEQTQPQQIPLFDFSSIRVEPHKPRRSYQYYVTRKRNQEMLAGFAADGSPVWATHDTRFVKPHVFKNNYRARQFAQKNAGQVVSYEYAK